MRISDWSSDVCSSDLHVSMAAHGARRLLDMADNVSVVIGIELLAACQGIDFHAPLKSSHALEAAHEHLRTRVPALEDDRHFHPDMEAATALIRSEEHTSELQSLMRTSYTVFCL